MHTREVRETLSTVCLCCDRSFQSHIELDSAVMTITVGDLEIAPSRVTQFSQLLAAPHVTIAVECPVVRG